MADNKRTAQELADECKALRRRFGKATIEACLKQSSSNIKELIAAEAAIDEFMARLAAQAARVGGMLVTRITCAYEQGVGHALRHELSNPYNPGTLEHEAWDHGREYGRRHQPGPPAPAQAEQSEDGRDAARYRLMRAHGRCESKHGAGFVIGDTFKAKVSFRYWVSDSELDAILDAVIAAKEQQS